MALYRYFTTKDELVDALLNQVLGRFEASPPTDDWATDLRTFALDHRRMLTRHQWAIAPLTLNPNPGPNALHIGEAALRILHRGGIDGDDAVATLSGLLALNYGWVSFLSGKQRAEAAGQEVVVALPPSMAEAFPLTVGVAGPMSRYGSDDHYETVLRQLLCGIVARG
jgi:AcrR family transcriptional regulator